MEDGVLAVASGEHLDKRNANDLTVAAEVVLANLTSRTRRESSGLIAAVKGFGGNGVSNCETVYPFTDLDNHASILMAENCGEVLVGYQVARAPSQVVEIRAADSSGTVPY
jgi:hypothetical protein